MRLSNNTGHSVAGGVSVIYYLRSRIYSIMNHLNKEDQREEPPREELQWSDSWR